MKYSRNLIRLAHSLKHKYAQSQTLSEIILNAAGFGEQGQAGIMDFPTQLKKDKADLSINITIEDGDLVGLGGRKITVSSPIVYPPEYAGNYSRLPEQIKKFLDKHISGFPQIKNGTTTIRCPESELIADK